MENLEGQIFNRMYQVLEKIGSGGMSTVYKGIIVGLNKIVAIKVISKKVLTERFLKEASALSRLNHPNIIDIYWVGNEKSYYYMVMKYIEGITFARMIKDEGPLSFQSARAIFYPILNALGYMHEMGVLHRDVKPSNVMIDRHGAIIITDFGLAKITSEEEITKSRETMGTPEYISPEQIVAAKDIDHRADIYSFGILMYEALTGITPFSGDLFEVINKHMTEMPKSPQEIVPSIPTELSDIVMKCLEKNPADRFQSAGELLKNLQSFEQNYYKQAQGLMPTIIISQQKIKDTEPEIKITDPNIRLKDSKSIDWRPKFREAYYNGKVDEMMEILHNFVEHALNLWTAEEQKLLERMSNVMEISLAVENLVEAGSFLIQNWHKDIDQIFTSSEGYFEQIARLYKKSLNRLIRKNFMEKYHLAKTMLKTERIEILHPAYLTNLIVKTIITLGGLCVFYGRINLLKLLLTTSLHSADITGSLASLVGYEGVAEKESGSLLTSTVRFIKVNKIYEYFDESEESVWSSLVKFDYLRCTWLFKEKMGFFTFFRSNVKKSIYEQAILWLRENAKKFYELFQSDPLPIFNAFDKYWEKNAHLVSYQSS